MGRRGPRKTPTKELEKRGAWRAKTALRQFEVQADPLTEVPAAPEWMTPGGADIWNAHAPAAVENGLLTPMDVGAFALYCDALYEYRVARDQVERDGITIDGRLNPAVRVRDEARKSILAILREIGHTPASRVGLVLDKKQQNKKPELKLFAKG